MEKDSKTVRDNTSKFSSWFKYRSYGTILQSLVHDSNIVRVGQCLKVWFMIQISFVWDILQSLVHDSNKEEATATKHSGLISLIVEELKPNKIDWQKQIEMIC